MGGPGLCFHSTEEVAQRRSRREMRENGSSEQEWVRDEAAEFYGFMDSFTDFFLRSFVRSFVRLFVRSSLCFMSYHWHRGNYLPFD